MSHIEDLISHHCPNGVQYLRISDLGNFVSGLKGKTKADFTNGNAKFVSYKNVFDNIEVDFSNLESVKINDGERQTKLRRGDLIFTSSSENLDESGMTSVVTKDVKEDIFLNSFCFFVHLPDSIKPEFAKYLFRSTRMRKQIIKCANGVTRYNISKKALEKIKFPVPPLEVQDEIVRILDSFTELEANLQTELEARRKQYEYYRDSLLDVNNPHNPLADMLAQYCPDGVEFRPLGELLRKNLVGGTPSRAKADYWNGDIPWASVGDLSSSTQIIDSTRQNITSLGLNNSSSKLVNPGDLLVATRILPGLTRIAGGELAINQDIRAIQPTNLINNKFLFYIFSSLTWSTRGTIVKSISNDQLKKRNIPVPPLPVQERIVAILDKFDALVNDLSSGLPAEIAARRKQYEYYRDQLLAFTPAN